MNLDFALGRVVNSPIFLLRRLGLVVLLLANACWPLRADPLPLKAFFEEPQFVTPRLSPDGRRIAVLLQKEHKQWLTQLDVATMKPEPIAYLEEAKLINHWWKGDDYLLLLVESTSGSRDFRCYNFHTKKVQSLKRLQGRNVTLLHPLPKDPDNVLASIELGGAQDLCRLNIRTGNIVIIEKGPRYVTRWIINRHGDPVAALGNQDKHDFLLWRPALGAPWVRRDLGNENHPDLSIATIHMDQRRLLAWDFTPVGPARVVAFDPATMVQEEILTVPDFDPYAIIPWAGDPTRPCAIEYETDHPKLHFLDEEARQLQASVDDALPDTVNRVISSSNDAQVMVILATSDHDGGTYYILNRRLKTLAVLGVRHLGYATAKFQTSRQITYPARDGLILHGRIILPAPGAKHPPLVVITPFAFAGSRTRYNFDVLAQLFVTRGYAVVRFDHRGTSGYGWAFRKAGDFQITDGMPNDIEDGVRWLTQEGLIDEQRVVLFGIESGGIVAIHTLARSKLFAAWINWNTPLYPSDYGFQELAMFPHERSEAITDLGGRKAAALYRESIDPKPLVPRIAVPSFHFYEHGSAAGSMQELLKNVAAPHSFLREKQGQSEGQMETEAITMLEQMFRFLQEHHTGPSLATVK